MPELPEVETVRRALALHLDGRVIAGIIPLRAGLRRPFPANLSTLAGAKIARVGRRAKWLLIPTDRGLLLSHLGMTGTWRVADGTSRPHDHLHLRLADGPTLIYRDPRRFGVIDLVATGATSPDLAILGQEPLDPGFSGASLAAAAQGRTQAVKPVIMDQAVVVGVGNIYAQEALHRAGISPKRKAHRVKPAEWEALARAIRTVLDEAIAAGGSTISDFATTDGGSGYFQHAFRVYARAGKACLHCGATLKGMQLAGRTTTWCPACQR